MAHSNDDAHAAEYERLTAELDAHPGTLANQMMSDVVRAFRAWFQRSQELRKLLHRGETDATFQMELMQNVHAPTVREAYTHELDSTLVAYLGAMGALIDIARRVAKALPDEFRTEYDARSKVVRAIDGVSLIRDLRNYMLHYGVAPWHLSGTITAEGMTGRVGLASRELLRSSGWNAVSKAYMKKHEVVRLSAIVTPYEAAMLPLYEWFNEEFYRHKKPDLDAANELVRNVNLHLTGGVTDGQDWPERMEHMQENLRRWKAGEPQTDYETGEPIIE
ncbi:hypothetical protein [Microbacterium proteolyticum]|uniref:hypothetical protein n=1 Tax=Microbacterium proteolyticum TaxID=1572644 RepID=UPI001FAD99BF|nr:hypothetical protein [Microbacterium proteolyticum]MCI9856782.1 hypothetical protein [Microbacterium proteolyticum]